MNLFSARLVLRPRLLTEVLDLAAPFCVANAGLLGRLSLTTLLPIAAIAAGARLGLRWSWGEVWLLLIPLCVLAEAVFTLALGEALFRPPAEIRAAAVVGKFVRRLPLLVFMQMLRLVVVLGCASVLVPLPLEGPRWLFIGEALLLEESSARECIRRSRALARDRLGFCLGLSVALLVLPAAMVMLAELMGGAVVGFVFQLGQPLGAVGDDGGSAFAVLGLLLSAPLAACLRFLGYIDLRTRKEGWDIQLRFASWAEREKAAQPWAA